MGVVRPLLLLLLPIHLLPPHLLQPPPLLPRQLPLCLILLLRPLQPLRHPDRLHATHPVLSPLHVHVLQRSALLRPQLHPPQSRPPLLRLLLLLLQLLLLLLLQLLLQLLLLLLHLWLHLLLLLHLQLHRTVSAPQARVRQVTASLSQVPGAWSAARAAVPRYQWLGLTTPASMAWWFVYCRDLLFLGCVCNNNNNSSNNNNNNIARYSSSSNNNNSSSRRLSCINS